MLGTWDMFVFSADVGISFLVMVVGMFLVPGLGLGEALLAILVVSTGGGLQSLRTGPPRRFLGHRGRFPEEWRAATRHAFLDAVRDGRVPDAAFATWILRTTWFEHRRARYDVQRLQATERYRALLEALDAAAYPVASVGLWAIERAYLDAWQSAAPGAKAYSEFVAHWTVPEFATYVDGLAGAANQALSVATPDEQAEAVATLLAVAQLEADFWQMAYTQS